MNQSFFSKWITLFRQNYRDISWYRDILEGLLFRFYNPFRRGVHVTELEWDILIILDACRYDLFENKLNKKMKKHLTKVTSLGSCTVEFLLKNFKGRKFDNIIYITANPFVDVLVKDSFHKVIPAWKLAWNKKYNTVLPNDLATISKLIKKKYPDKKLIIHFMQPHYPFISEGKPLGSFLDIRNYAAGKSKEFVPMKDDNPWALAKKGKLDKDFVWDAYVKNLDVVFPVAMELAKYFTKKYGSNVVISADHGNVIYDKFIFKIYGHPCNRHLKELVEVPWFTYPKNT